MEVIEVTEREVEVIEVVERGPAGPQGIQGPSGASSWNEISGKPSTFPPSSHTHPISEVVSLQGSLDLKANLESPALTGTPTATTAAAGTNTTQIATTAFTLANRGDRYLTTSTSSHSITTGSKTFVVQSGLSYTPTQDVTIVYDAARHMHGIVTSYSGTSLVINVESVEGSGGPFTAWTINVGGLLTAQGALLEVNNLSDVSNPATALTNIGGVPTSRSISAGTGLTGGGDLTANRTLAVSYGTTAGTAAEGNDARLTNSRTPTAHTHVSADITDATSDETPNTIVKRDAYGNAKFNSIQVTDVTPPVNEVWLAGFDNSGTIAAISPADSRDFIGLDTDDAVTFGSIQNTPIGSTTRNTGAFTTLSAAPTSGSALTLTGGTVTASAPLIDATQTWNNAAVTFTGLAATITNTASATGSLVARLTVGSTNVFEVDARGFTKVRKVATSTDFASVFEVLRGTTSVARIRDDGDISGNAFAVTGAGNVVMNSGGVGILSTGRFGFSVDTFGGNTDTDLRRDAADTLAQRRSTNAQTFRIYNTFTSTTNFERLNIIAQSAGSVIIGTEKGSAGGTARALEFQTDGATRVTITTGGQFRLAEGASYQTNNRGVFIFTADGVAAIRDWNSTGAIFLRIGTESSTNLFPALKRSSTALQVRLADDSAFAPFACAGLTLNGDLTASTRNLVTDTTTGTKIGTGTTQLLGFWNATPAAQPAAVADATDAATTQARLNDLLARLRTIGVIAT